MNAGADTLTHIRAVDAVSSARGRRRCASSCAASRRRATSARSTGSPGATRDGTIRHNAGASRSPTSNLLPLPARHLEPWEKYNFRMEVPGKGLLPGGNLMTSRGCPFTCTFCATPANWGRRVRALSPENVVARDRAPAAALRRAGDLVLRRHLQLPPRARRGDLRPDHRAPPRHQLVLRGARRHPGEAAAREDGPRRPLPRRLRHRVRLGARLARHHHQARHARRRPTTWSTGRGSSASSRTPSSSSATRPRPGRRRRRRWRSSRSSRAGARRASRSCTSTPARRSRSVPAARGSSPADFSWSVDRDRG